MSVAERGTEREREGEKRKEKKKWVKRRKETTETGRMEGGGGGKNLERQRLEERSGWSRKRKDAG